MVRLSLAEIIYRMYLWAFWAVLLHPSPEHMSGCGPSSGGVRFSNAVGILSGTKTLEENKALMAEFQTFITLNFR